MKAQSRKLPNIKNNYLEKGKQRPTEISDLKLQDVKDANANSETKRNKEEVKNASDMNLTSLTSLLSVFRKKKKKKRGKSTCCSTGSKAALKAQSSMICQQTRLTFKVLQYLSHDKFWGMFLLRLDADIFTKDHA